MIGFIRKVVGRVKKCVLDMVQSFELKNSTQCKILMASGIGIGVTLFLIGYNKYPQFKELEALQHQIDVNRLKECLV